jgi:hypothetical protein
MANDKDNQGPKKKEDEIGEGNHDADRRYRDATEEYVKSGRPDPAGREAQRSMDDERERRDLEEAERRARQGSPHPGSKDARPSSDRDASKSAGNPRGSGGGKRS